jgi:predicted permease
METLLQDVRYGLRSMRNNPGFTAVVVITLALGIGANTAIFTLVHAVLLKSLPVPTPKQLYRFGNNDNCCVWGGYQDDFGIFSFPLYKHLREQSTADFEELAAFQAETEQLGVRRAGTSAQAESFVGEFVSGNYFSMFRVNAYAGRLLTLADDIPSAPPAAVMSYRAWQSYAFDHSVVGGGFAINGVPFTVIGVAPPGFFGDTLRSDPPDFFIPLADEPVLKGKSSLLNEPDLHWLYIIGRLKPGAVPEAVQTRLVVQLQQWLKSGADPTSSYQDPKLLARTRIELTPAGGGVATMRYEFFSSLRLLIAISGLVLVIACANVANLLLARSTSNRRQISVRVALGASRPRLIRQMLTESILLALLGGVAGVFVAYNGTRAILLLAFRGASYIPISAAPSMPILAFTLLTSFLTGVFFGVAPAWISSHSDPAEALRATGRSTRDRTTLPQKALVVLQGALSLVLVIGAGLLTRSLNKLQDQRFGFETQGRVIVKVDPRLAGYTPERLSNFYQQIEQRLSQIPGVVSAAFSKDSPMGGNRWSNDVFFEDGRVRAKAGEEDYAVWNRVSPRYFETVGTPILRGRSVDERDTPTSRRVVVVNETFARRYYGNDDPLGKRFGMGGRESRADYQIIGVVGDAKYHHNPRTPVEPMAFLPFFQMTGNKDPQFVSSEVRSNYIENIELRVAGGRENLEPMVRHSLAQIDPDLPVTELLTLAEQVKRDCNEDRLVARLTEVFGVLALALASVGLYGVTAYAVARRTGEIGIRMALGADQCQVLAMILRSAFLQVALGLAIGVPAALAAGQILSNQLYGVKQYDPIVFCVAVLALATCAFVAALIPARRAAGVDPLVALRYE